MQSTLIRLAVALLAFGLGVSATMFWIAYRTPDVKHLEHGTRHAHHPLPPLPPAPPSMDALPPPPPRARAPISSGVLDGKVVSRFEPIYPSDAISLKVSGKVVVQVLVDEYGQVISAKPVSGNPLLQQAAVKAAYLAEFAPTFLEGQRVKVTGTLSYNFVL